MTIEINKDEKAPYSGVIITESTFRQMWLDIKKSDLLKSELQSCLDNRTQYEQPNPELWVMGGFAAGLLSVLLVNNLMK